MSDFWFYASVVGIVVIIALASYATKLLLKLKKQNESQQLAQQAKQASLAKHDKKILDSVVIIVRAMKEEQCDVAEGCWRLSVLLDSLKLSSALDQQFTAIFELYNRIKHMPILEERKKLDKKARMKLDYQRMQIEAELTEQVKSDVEQLHQYANERISVLSA
ncbi:DUF2489 domain-containing protein [Thalassotalea sp. PLHSN55]|uniref:DUF2489 domain-containing protein n=1 Tax=Thalassotalea sp. PLHSN55 TaxID=3435888 RepID=UPI003F874666